MKIICSTRIYDFLIMFKPISVALIILTEGNPPFSSLWHKREMLIVQITDPSNENQTPIKGWCVHYKQLPIKL